MRNYKLNNLRIRNIGDKILVTSNHNSWIFLEKDEFDSLIKENLTDEELFVKLEKTGLIITKDNEEIILNKLRKKYNFLNNGTSLHIIIPTLRCNHKCVYCHASSKDLNAENCDMNEETAKKTVDFVFQSPSKAITIEFQGGEPLIRFDIIRTIIDYAYKKNEKGKKDLRFALVTNFSLMDKDKLDYLIKNNVGICTSLDGSKELHNKNRLFIGQGNSYDFVTNWLERLKKEYLKRSLKDRKASALITITKYSLPYWKEIIDEYVRQDINTIHLRFLNNLGDARNTWENISYSAEEFIDFWKKSMDYIIDLNKKGVNIKERITGYILDKILNEGEPNYLEQRSPCGAVIGQLTYNYNGDIYTCDEARMIGEDIFKLGNVKSDSYKQLLTSNKSCGIISASINDCQICDACVYKPYCGICPVCNYAEQGSIIGKIPETARCKIYKAQFDYIFDKILNDSEARKVFDKWIEQINLENKKFI
jgi:His-Xaa-Ser system radical SAM maturase HxsB